MWTEWFWDKVSQLYVEWYCICHEITNETVRVAPTGATRPKED